MEGAVVPHFGEDGIVRALVNGGDGIGDGKVGGEEGLELGKGFEVGLLHFTGVGDELEVGGAGGVEPGGAKEDELFKAIGVTEGDVQSDAGAHGEAAEVAFFDAEVIHEGDDVIGEGVKGVGGGIEGHGVAVAGHVGGDEMVAGEVIEPGGRLGFPGTEAMEEYQGLAINGAKGVVGKKHV